MDRVRTEKAAQIIGCSRRLLTYQMDKGIWDLWTVTRSKTGRRSQHIVFRAKLEKMIGRPLTGEEINEDFTD